MSKPTKREQAAMIVNRGSFTIRALRLVKRLDLHCRDRGMQAYLHEWDTWNADYPSDVKLLMGEVFEIMRLRIFAEQHGLMPKD